MKIEKVDGCMGDREKKKERRKTIKQEERVCVYFIVWRETEIETLRMR